MINIQGVFTPIPLSFTVEYGHILNNTGLAVSGLSMMHELASLDEALALLAAALDKRGKPPIAFVGQRGTDAFALKAVLARIDYPLDRVFCLDRSQEHEDLETEVVSLESLLGRRDTWYSEALDNLYRSGLLNLKPGSLIFAYSNFPALEQAAQEAGCTMLTTCNSVQQPLQNKLLLTDLLIRSGLPVMPNLAISLQELDVSRCMDLMRIDKLVVQLAQGTSGAGTFFVRDGHQAMELIQRFGPMTMVKVAPCLEGFSFAATGCVTDRQVVWSLPAAQVIGDKTAGVLCNHTAVYCGSDFHTAEELLENNLDLDRLTTFGETLRSFGFRGIFNVDVFSPGHYLLDLNARCPGSIRMLTELELVNGTIPLILLQMLSFLDVDVRVAQTRPKPGQRAAFFILHGLGKRPERAEVRLTPGVYGMEGESWVRKGPGSGLNDFEDGQVLVTGGLPQGAAEVMPEAPLCRIWTKSRIIGPDMRVTDETLSTALHFYEMFGLHRRSTLDDESEADKMAGLNHGSVRAS